MIDSKKRTALLGLFGALVIVATAVMRFPVPTFNLYFNLGEAVIYLTALLFGGPSGAIVGGVGSALADVLGGYPVWAPITLVIKGLEGYIVGKAAKRVLSPRGYNLRCTVDDGRLCPNGGSVIRFRCRSYRTHGGFCPGFCRRRYCPVLVSTP